MDQVQRVFRIAVVDDRQVPRAAARSMLSDAGDLVLVGEAASGADALVVIPMLKPDIVLMDVDMSDLDGAETTRRLRQLMPDITILAWTVSDNSDDLVRMIRAGCDGYVLKDVGPAELQRAIRAAIRAEAPIPRRMFSEVLKRATKELSHSVPASVSLTTREADTLRLLAKGLPLKQIANELEIAPSSADTHVRNLYRKLGVNNRGEAIGAALRMGVLSLSDM